MSAEINAYPVPVMEVHKVTHFLLFGRLDEKPKVVKCCPECYMPCFLWYGHHNQTVVCDICGKWLRKDDLLSFNVPEYLSLIRTLPLQRNGEVSHRPYSVSWITSEAELKKYKRYVDLSEEDLNELDTFIVK